MGFRPVLSPVLSHSLLLRWLQEKARCAPETALCHGCCLPPQALPSTGKGEWMDSASWGHLGHPQGHPSSELPQDWLRPRSQLRPIRLVARGTAACIPASGSVSREPTLGFQRARVGLHVSGVHPVIARTSPAASSFLQCLECSRCIITVSSTGDAFAPLSP